MSSKTLSSGSTFKSLFSWKLQAEPSEGMNLGEEHNGSLSAIDNTFLRPTLLVVSGFTLLKPGKSSIFGVPFCKGKAILEGPIAWTLGAPHLFFLEMALDSSPGEVAFLFFPPRGTGGRAASFSPSSSPRRAFSGVLRGPPCPGAPLLRWSRWSSPGARWSSPGARWSTPGARGSTPGARESRGGVQGSCSHT